MPTECDTAESAADWQHQDQRAQDIYDAGLPTRDELEAEERT